MAIRVICAMLMAVWLPASVVARQPDAFDACAREQDPTLRLACFDRATAARHARDQATPPSRRPAREARPERAAPSPPRPTSIAAKIVKVIPRTPFISAFVLDNGQIWEQSEATRFSAEPQEQVTIRHGAFGSFFLDSADGSVRVHRVK